MVKNRLAYRLLMVLMLFTITLLTPVSLMVYYKSAAMVRSMDRIEPLMTEQMEVYERFKAEILDVVISLTFYVFVLSFILSLFLARSFLLPVRELYRGAMALKEGNLETKVQVTTDDELGEVTKAFNEMTDTLRDKTKELLRKDTYVNSMLDPLWAVDLDYVIIDVNPAFTNLFGYERDEVIGASIFDFLDEDNERTIREHLEDKGMSSSYAISIISRDEGLVPALVSGAPIFENNEVVARMGIMKDFRHEMAMRDALRDEKEHSEAIMDSIVDSLLVIDRNYVIVKANQAAMVDAGRDIIGHKCHQVLHGSEETCFARGMDCPVKISFETGRSYKTVHEHTEGGENRVIREINTYPVRDSSGEVKHVVELMRDITERKGFEDELDQRNKELTTLNSISRVLSQSLRAEDIFNTVLEKIISMVGMDGGGIYFLNETGKELECRYQKGFSEDFMDSTRRVRVGQDIPGKVAVTGQGIVTPDISREAMAKDSVLRHSGIKGFACMPIRGKEKLLGVFYIFSLNPHIFTPEEERILNSIGETTGIAFENIRLYEKMRELYEQQKKRRTEEQRNLLALSTSLTSTSDINEVLDPSITAIKESNHADFAWLLQIDNEGGLVLAASSQGLKDRGESIYPGGTSAIEWHAIENKKPGVFTELSTESRFHLPDFLVGFNTACIVPLFAGDKALGALGLYYRSFRAPTEEDLFSLQTAGSILSVSIERASLSETAIVQKGMAETILQSIGDGIMTVDMDGKVISMNKAAQELTGTALSSSGFHYCDVFATAKRNAGLNEVLDQCLKEAVKGNAVQDEAEYHYGDGKVTPIKISSAPVLDKKGLPVGVVYVLRDISRDREIETMKNEFVKSVSHEFRTPISAIVGMTEMLLEDEVKGKRAVQYLNTIHEEGTRLSDMVSDLLDVARIESGREVFKETAIDFDNVLSDVGKSFEKTIEKKEVDFSYSLKGALKGYKGDEEKIKQLLRNLMDNSLTYSEQGCTLRVTVTRSGGSVLIDIKDNGWGIPGKDLKRLGEKFYRGRHASKAKGTGLGLSLSMEIVKMHQGTISFKSTPGKGTTVGIKLPFRRKK